MIFKKGNITIITPETPGNMDPLPDLGEIYYAYDDGKIRRSRECKVKITKHKPLWLMPLKFKRIWKKQTKECYWLYAKKTDYVVVAETIGDKPELCYFVRTHGGHWHSVEFGNNIMTDNLSLDLTGDMHGWLDEWEEINRRRREYA